MRINFSMSRCLLGVTALLVWGVAAITPAKADICFLPTGICEQGALNKVAESKSCQDYINEGTYFAEEQANKNCSLVSIEGCTLWECTPLSCESRGYKLGPTNGPTEWPSGYSSSSWSCEYCQQGSKYRWKCSPKACVAGFTRVDATCGEGWEWVAVAAYGKSGEDDCGNCVISECPSGSTMTPEPGCKTCEVVKELDSTRKCYDCKDMPSIYKTQAEKDSDYDDSCYSFDSKQAADGSMCYKPVEIDCGKDQFMTKETISGKQMCKCRDYTYKFHLEKAADSSIVLSAAGQSKLVGVVSQRCGNNCDAWDYDVAITSGNGKLKAQKFNGGPRLQIDGPINKSQTTDLYYTIKLTQTWGDEATTREITINVRVEHDTCPDNAPQFTDQCTTAGWKSKNEGTSVTGEKCYKCYNDNCPSGYNKGTTPTDGNYDTSTTDYGSNCYKPKPDTCPSGYTNVGTNNNCSSAMGKSGNYDRTQTEFGHYCCKAKDDTCPSGYTKGSTPTSGNYYTTTTAFGSNCYMPKDDNCPSGYTKGPTPSPTSGYYTATTDFGSNCYLKKNDDCPSGQAKSCECDKTPGSKTDFGTQCYICSPCCYVGDNGAYGPGLWGADCLDDNDCLSSSDHSLICVNKNSYGCGKCLECWNNDTESDCAKMDERRAAKSYGWFYVPAGSGESCDRYIGNHCMKKDPNQKYGQYVRSNGEIINCITNPTDDHCTDFDYEGHQSSTGECINGYYPDAARDDNDVYHYSYCQTPIYNHSRECTAGGECKFM